MPATASHAPHHAAPATVTPLLRTVLLCDLVESTALVERLGDSRVAVLLQRHDQLLVQLLARCQGQMIDKADGILALFERPVQALEFAIHYQRGLRSLGQESGETMQARIGIHVGDVMTWTHTPAEILAGAKPVEVEGLAKPIAARLMGLALPGQILLSGMAQILSQRAQAELGSDAAQLRWLQHGRYRFKGVPAPMLVHEVGEAGLAPLKPPPSGAKAWRELPLWRKPPVLALEVLLVAGLIGAGLWTIFRSPPAIAFAERDWVVVADFNNRTGQTLYDDALDSALRIGLEQSRYVNVLSDLQVDQALQRMQRAGKPIDRQTGSELALREGARALVLPTIAEVGGRPRVSVEVIDPNSGVTVYTQMADASGTGGVVAALDDVLAGIRSDLGESLTNIEKNSVPLEKATTSDLEALRAFSLGQKAFALGDMARSVAHYKQAHLLDAEFALAIIGRAKVHHYLNEFSEAAALAKSAHSFRNRLSKREMLYLDAWLEMVEGRFGYAEKWRYLLDLYPDFHVAAFNYANACLNDNRFRDALDAIQTALVPQAVTRPAALHHQGIALLGLERISDAITSFDAATASGRTGSSRFLAGAQAALRKYDQANSSFRIEGKNNSNSSFPDLLMQTGVWVDEGRWRDVVAGIEQQRLGGNENNWKHSTFLAVDWLEGGGKSMLVNIQRVINSGSIALADADPTTQEEITIAMLYAAYLAVGEGNNDLALVVLKRTKKITARGPHSAAKDLAEVVRARIDLHTGDATTAAARLEGLIRGNELVLAHVILTDVYRALGRFDDALAQLKWVDGHRGRAYAEWSGTPSLRIENIVHTRLSSLNRAEIALRQRQFDNSSTALKEFNEGWADLTRAPKVRARVQVVADALGKPRS